MNAIGSHPTIPAPSGALDDAWGLMLLVGVFTVTPLVVVAALWGALVLDSWVAFVGVMVVHLVATAVVFAAVAAVLAGHRPRGKTSPASDAHET